MGWRLDYARVLELQLSFLLWEICLGEGLGGWNGCTSIILLAKETMLGRGGLLNALWRDRRGCRKHLPTSWDSSMAPCIEYSLGICASAYLVYHARKDLLGEQPSTLGEAGTCPAP